MPGRRVDQRDAAKDVVRVIEPANEMAQTFCRVGGEVEDVVGLVAGEELVDERRVGTRADDERRLRAHVLGDTAAEIIEHHHAMATSEKGIDHVASDKSGASCHQRRGRIAHSGVHSDGHRFAGPDGIMSAPS